MRTGKLVFALGIVLTLGMWGCSDDTTAPDGGKKDKGVDGKVTDKGITDTGTTPDKATGDKATTDTGTTGDKGKGDTGKTGDGTTTTLTISGTLTNFLTKLAVPLVNVCVKELTTVTCVKSDTSGKYSLTGVPKGQDLTITYTLTGYQTFGATIGKAQTDLTYNMNMLDDGTVGLMLAALSITKDVTKGHLILTSLAKGAATMQDGTSIKLDKTAGEGPYYMATTGMPDKTLKETTLAGYAFILNIAPGTYEVTSTNSKGKTCTVFHGWAGAKTDASKFTVAANEASIITMICQ